MGRDINARLQAAARVLGLEPARGHYGLRPSALAHAAVTLADLLTGDVYLLVLELLERDVDKASLACACRGLLAEQRRSRPAAAYRARMSLAVLVGARRAGWSLSHCHIDKKSGLWTPKGEDDDLFADLCSLSVVGRPDVALLVLSPFTDLTAMSALRVFELDSCAVGDAGVAVLAAVFRQPAVLTALEVLDLRRNQVGDGGARVLAAALASHAHADGATLGRLTTLGLDCNPIGSAGLAGLAHALNLGALAALHSLFVDRTTEASLVAACAGRDIELSSW